MPRIIILDHSPDFLDIVTLIFKQAGTAVATCSSLELLFEKLMDGEADLLMLDVMHREVYANTTREDLRKRWALNDIPILITSTRPDDIHHYQEFGANDALQKPCNLEDIIYKVKTLLHA